MAQGTIKAKKLSSATTKASGGRHSVLGPKKGARTIAPRKQALVKKQKMVKVRTILSLVLSLWWYGTGLLLGLASGGEIGAEKERNATENWTKK
jgi:hypothetical protein